MEDNLDTEITIKIPLKIKETIEEKAIDVSRVVSNALISYLKELEYFTSFHEKKFPSIKNPSEIESNEIPPGSFAFLPNLTMEQYEHIVDETSWEYLNGKLIHYSPESNFHNAILNSLVHQANLQLDMHTFVLRTSRIAISIEDSKPEPDFMLFDKNDFRKKKRKDGTLSEIIESSPLLVIEIVSETSESIDELKADQYLSKSIKEYWRIFSNDPKMHIIVGSLRNNQYEFESYECGEVRSRILPEFAVRIEELRESE